MIFPIQIESQRLIITKPNGLEYTELFHTYTNDPRVVRYMTWEIHKSPDETKVFLKTCLEKWEDALEYNALLIRKSTGKIIGMIRITAPKKNMATIGYVVAFDEWNKGFATEAMKTVISYIFSTGEIDRITSTCDVENSASARVMQKAGMTFRQVRPNFVRHPNISEALRDALEYDITIEEFQKQKNTSFIVK